MANSRFDLQEEFRQVPRVVIVLAVLAFVGVQLLFHFVIPMHHHGPLPPRAIRTFFATLAGIATAIYIMLAGYVWRDTKRRGMNRALWMVLVVFIPNALGFVLYFLLRNPLAASCPQCGTAIESGFNFCPKCRFMLASTCQCGRTLQPGFECCPYCGRAVEHPSTT